jgi:8-amino-7-oxononanoate synthase
MPADVFERRLAERVLRLREQGMERSLRAPAGVDLSSNDYLNLSTDPRLINAFVRGLWREGCGSTGSRLLRGGRACFEQLERRFARFKRAESALFFGSGFLANIAVLSTLAERGDIIFSDERNHASLIDGIRLSRAEREVFPHNDVPALAARLRQREARGAAAVSFVVVESLFSMDGDIAPLQDYGAICEETGAVLIVDEAHAVGIYGTRGSGLLEECGVANAVSINTAGKALGASGAFVAGPRTVVGYLVQRARPFVFSTAPPPALADALEASLTIVESEPDLRRRLLCRAAFLREQLAAAGVSVAPGRSQIVPILLGDSDAAVGVAESLQSQGFDARAIRPPTVPDGTARLRVSVNAALEESMLSAFAGAVSAAIGKVGVCAAASS